MAPENQGKWTEIAAELCKATWQEEGCIFFNFVKNPQNPNRFFIVEEWQSQKHLDDHFESEHFKRLGPQFDELDTTISFDICQNAIDVNREK